MTKQADDFNGRMVWGSVQDHYRDQEGYYPDVYRAWEELDVEEQYLYGHIGDSLLNYFRNTESNEVLRQKLEAATERFEKFRTAIQSQNKENGGR